MNTVLWYFDGYEAQQQKQNRISNRGIDVNVGQFIDFRFLHQLEWFPNQLGFYYIHLMNGDASDENNVEQILDILWKWIEK